MSWPAELHLPVPIHSAISWTFIYYLIYSLALWSLSVTPSIYLSMSLWYVYNLFIIFLLSIYYLFPFVVTGRTPFLVDSEQLLLSSSGSCDPKTWFILLCVSHPKYTLPFTAGFWPSLPVVIHVHRIVIHISITVFQLVFWLTLCACFSWI